MLAGVLVLGVSAKQFLSGWDELYARSLLLGRRRACGGTGSGADANDTAPSLLPGGAGAGSELWRGAAGGDGADGRALQIHGEALGLKLGAAEPGDQPG